MYRKEIIYIGLYKNDNRIGSAGFLKVESRERDSRLYLKTQNIPLGISGRFPVRVYNGSGWKEINGLAIRDGGGIWEDSLDGNVSGPIIQVMLSGGYMLEGKSKSASETVLVKNAPESHSASAEQKSTDLWNREEIRQDAGSREQEAVQADKVQNTSQADAARDIKQADTIQDTVRPDKIKDTIRTDAVQDRVKTDIVQDPVRPEAVQDTAQANTVYSTAHEKTQDLSNEDVRQEQNKVIITEELKCNASEDGTESKSLPNYNLKEDKWEQLLDTYENIHPYGDGRVYVKLEPKDFVILQSKYQHLVNNSFLLHGFYNYRYIILGKEKNYYLGVPGVFYEREKMVAQMFGFEAFECPGGNVRAGEFGYYLRKVEI